MNPEEYPKEAILRDGSRLLLRPLLEEDLPGLQIFFGTLPEEEKIYIRDEDLDPCLSVSWPKTADYRRVLPILALTEGGTVGVGVLHPGNFSWSTHVGNIRITVSSAWRRQGLGRILAGELFRSALHAGLEKIVAEVVEEQVDVSLFYNDLGFHTEAQLQSHFLDERGQKHDILLMSNDLRQLWKLWVEEGHSVDSGEKRGGLARRTVAKSSGRKVLAEGRSLAMDGSSAGKIKRKNPQEGGLKMGRKILVPVDLSAQSIKVIEAAKSLTKEGDHLILFHVVLDPSHWGGAGAPHISTEKVGEEMLEMAGKDLERFVERYAPGASFLVRFGIPYKEILAFAKEEKVDLIVLGKPEAGGTLENILTSRTSKKVFLKAECDVEAVHLASVTEEEVEHERKRW